MLTKQLYVFATFSDLFAVRTKGEKERFDQFEKILAAKIQVMKMAK